MEQGECQCLRCPCPVSACLACLCPCLTGRLCSARHGLGLCRAKRCPGPCQAVRCPCPCLAVLGLAKARWLRCDADCCFAAMDPHACLAAMRHRCEAESIACDPNLPRLAGTTCRTCRAMKVCLAIASWVALPAMLAVPVDRAIGCFAMRPPQTPRCWRGCYMRARAHQAKLRTPMRKKLPA